MFCGFLLVMLKMWIFVSVMIKSEHYYSAPVLFALFLDFGMDIFI